MPFAIILEARPKRGVALQPPQGHHWHAAFLGLLGRYDPDLAEQSHEENTMRRFALACLPELGRSGGVSRVFLRVAGIDDRICRALVSGLTSEGAVELRLGGVVYVVDRVHADASAHPWSGIATYADVIAVTDAAERARTIDMEFATPTFFGQGEAGPDLPLPIPTLVFAGLAERSMPALTAITDVPEDFVRIIREAVTRAVALRWYDCAADKIAFQGKHVGFVGRVTFECVEDVPIDGPPIGLWYWCHLLAELSFFTGVGKKTSQGCGLVRTL